MNEARIPTGEIPGSQCPKCGAPLRVIDKKQPNAQYWGRNPQFVGCQNYHITGCTYRRKVNEADRATMKQAEEAFAALPAEF